MSFELKNVVIFLKIAVSTIPTIRQYPFTLLGGERHCKSQLSSPRTQNSVPLGLERTNHEATLGCVQF